MIQPEAFSLRLALQVPSIMTPKPSSKLIEPTARDNLVGIGLMLLSMFVFSAVDTIAKVLTTDFHPLQIVWTRQLGLVAGVFVMMALRGASLFETNRRKLQLARGLMAALSPALFITAINYVPLADAIAVTFVAPFVVTMFSALLLKEKVGIHRWSAVVVGFLGTLVILRPGFDGFEPALLLAVLAAVLFAFRQIISRYLSSSDKTETTVAYTALVAVMVLFIPLPFVWQTPVSGFHLLLMAIMAILAGLGEFLIIKALEVALAVVVSPVHYTVLIWGSLYGYFVFGDFPNYLTWIGAIIIILSGLYTLYREHKRAAR
ncbi:DMT family transporter [Alphaproteobacteria bacterium]|nr:DMT family transporter [Alphaproteobacteria bacterium]